MEKVLVTGGAGFIGSVLVLALAERGHNVVVIARGDAIPRDLKNHARVQVLQADVSDMEEMKRIGEEHKPEWIFHLAASNIQSGVTASSTTLVNTNVLGTQAVLEMAKGAEAKVCVTMGSFLEYGQRDTALSEDMRCAPPELYSITKLAGTLLAQSYAKDDGATPHIISFRLFTPYGPGVQQGRLVREMITRALRNEPLSLTRPTVTRDFIYIDDIVQILIEAAQHSSKHTGQIYNLGSGEKTTLESLASIVLKETASSSEVVWGGFGSVSYDSDLWQANMQKTFSAFSWRPKVSLEEGVQKTISWLQNESGQA